MPVPAPSALPAPDDLTHQLRQRLPDWAAVQWVPTSGSTNTDLLACARAGEPLPRLLGAHLQTAGRGRANRNFRTEPGDTLTFSCAFETRLPPAALPTLSVWLGVAACGALAERLEPDHRLCLKWPNDLQWGEAKLAGVLTESAGGMPGARTRLVIGMGMNLRGGAALSAALGREVADWEATGRVLPPDVIVSVIAGAWRAAVEHAESHWLPGHGLPGLPEAFARHDALANQAINVLHDGAIEAHGTAHGVTPDGRLRLVDGQGERCIMVGDISVRAEPAVAP